MKRKFESISWLSLMDIEDSILVYILLLLNTADDFYSARLVCRRFLLDVLQAKSKIEQLYVLRIKVWIGININGNHFRLNRKMVVSLGKYMNLAYLILGVPTAVDLALQQYGYWFSSKEISLGPHITWLDCASEFEGENYNALSVTWEPPTGDYESNKRFWENKASSKGLSLQLTSTDPKEMWIEVFKNFKFTLGHMLDMYTCRISFGSSMCFFVNNFSLIDDRVRTLNEQNNRYLKLGTQTLDYLLEDPDIWQ